MSQDNQLWYVKEKGRVKGPFTSGLISKNILLGRIHPDDELSQDKKNWRKASSVHSVMPDVIKNRHEPNYKERLRAARRWADERGEIREVRTNGEEKIFSPRKKMTHLGIKTSGVLGIFAFIIIVSAMLYAMFHFTPDDPVTQIDCASAGENGSIFDSCHLQRRNFSKRSLKEASFKNTLLQNSHFKQSSLQNSQFDYANLSNADLSHANFTQASLKAVDLSNTILTATIFTKADMSYANLTGAKGSKVKFSGANLSNAIWFDGRICAKGSVGQCLAK
ncbi:MAG: pentapeptide repeat-containing protein [gamma proteobacterium symbiont of Taylorina sp.]|nr:pentapeptide repeat-containing protein [gamma proteobacterium symbiont of Taylorina sp.]